MAAHNHERFVGRAVQSVLDQTFSDLELVITDGASTDDTAGLPSGGGARGLHLCRIWHHRPMTQMPSSLASSMVWGLSMMIVLPASTTRYLPPPAARSRMVSGPTQGTSKRMS